LLATQAPQAKHARARVLTSARLPSTLTLSPPPSQEAQLANRWGAPPKFDLSSLPTSPRGEAERVPLGAPATQRAHALLPPRATHALRATLPAPRLHGRPGPQSAPAENGSPARWAADGSALPTDSDNPFRRPGRPPTPRRDRAVLSSVVTFEQPAAAQQQKPRQRTPRRR
jgi:hypothetical protein